MSNKIVITGMGAVTPVGIGVDNYWNSLISGVCGIKDISCIDTSSLPIKQAAEVLNSKVKVTFSLQQRLKATEDLN